MEDAKDIISLALKGCSLARNFESNIQNLLVAHHDHHRRRILVDQCDEIIGAFTMVRHQLDYSLHPRPPLVVDQPEVVVAALSREMVAFGYTPPQAQPPPLVQGKGKEVADDGCMMNVDSSSGGGQGQQQQRNPTRRTSRKEENGRTIRVAAPQMGNTEVPPEDGHTWRKYGQKDILGARYPRSYYKCTHQKLCNCPAKKQVQRPDDDPSTFEILYRGDHTCHMSSTAPSLPPPPPQSVQHIMYNGNSSTPYRPTIIPPSQLNQRLFMDLHRPSSEGANTVFEPQQHQMVRARSCSSIGENNSAHAGPSFAVDFLSNPVMDLADVMFNSRSSSGNSMECIFPHSDDK